MTSNRKVRKDFDPTKEYSVSVAGCSEEEKKEVQQAFFDVGIGWASNGAKYGHLRAVLYTNKYGDGDDSTHYLYEGSAKECNMTAEKFLELVYEPEQVGHIHAEDAKTTTEPWELWQVKGDDGVWKDCQVKGSVDGWQHCSQHPAWWCATEYRRKPKTHIVHGVEIPDLRFTPKSGETYYHPFPYSTELVARTHYDTSHAPDTYRNEHGLCYEYSSEGRQAAIAHTKAWLGIA